MRRLVGSSLLALACLAGCNDQTITPGNAPPSATIEQPVEGAEWHHSESVALVGSVGDTGTRTEDLLVTWSSSRDGLLFTGLSPGPDGRVSVEATLSPGAHELTMQVEDAQGAKGDDTHSVFAFSNHPPEIDFVAPGTDDPLYGGTPFLLSALASDVESAPEALSVWWRVQDSEFATGESTPDSTGLALGSLALPEGVHILVASVRDEEGATGTATRTITVGPPNTPPTCAIVRPLPEEGFTLGQSVTFEASVSDAETPPSQLSVGVTSSLDGETGGLVATSSGTVLAPLQLSAGSHTLTLAVTDAAGAECTDVVLIRVSTPPTLTVSAPANQSVHDAVVPLLLTGTVNDQEDPPSALQVTVASDVDGPLGALSPDSLGGFASTLSGLTLGPHLITVTAVDLAGLSASQSVTVTLNAAPSTPVVALSPGAPTTTDALVAQLTTPSVDPDGGPSPVTYTWTWALDGISQPALTGATQVPAGATARGETWEVTVAASDGLSTSAAASASVTVGNSAPTITAPALGPVTLVEGEVATCTPGTSADDDGDPVSVSFAWSLDGVPFGGAGGTQLLPVGAAGQSAVCITTPHDGTDAGPPVSSAPLIVAPANSPPTTGTPSLTPSPLFADTDAHCSDQGTVDPDGDPVSIAFSWTLNGAVVPTSASTLPSASFGRGDVVACEVTPSDPTSTGAPMVVSATVQNSAPSVASATVTPSSPTEGQPATCTAGATSDADGDSVAIITSWFLDGTDLGLATGTITVPSGSAGLALTCIVTPSDGLTTGAPASSAPHLVQPANAAPTTGTPVITPVAPTTTTALTCSDTGTSDPDGDPVTLMYAWTVGGIPAATSTATLPATAFVRGDLVVCGITPSDGSLSGPTMSTSVVIANSPPSASPPSVSPTAPVSGDTLTCTAGAATDPDGDPVSFAYSWRVNGAAVASGTTWAATAPAGTTVTCRLTPSDGFVQGAFVDSAPITLGQPNQRPTVSAVSIAPGSIYTQTDATCTGTASDPDGDPVSLAYAWFVNGGAVGVTGPTLSSALFARGNGLRCEITPSDAGGAGTTGTSPTVAVLNSPPTAPTVTLQPSSPYAQEDLSCAVASPGTDSDGDTVSYSYGWSRNGSPQPYSGPTLSGSYTSQGQQWTCAVTPSDGMASGPAGSATVVVGAPCAPYTWWYDGDGDGYGTGTPVNQCGQPSGSWASTGGDCNDGLAWVNPGATEDCNVNLDEDCDGQVNENCQVCGDNVCTGSEECMEGSCPSDCCLEYEDFSFSTGLNSTPWYIPVSQLDIGEVFVNDVPSYASGTARVTGDYLRHDSNYISTPMFGTGIGTIYVRFEDTSVGTPVTLRVRFRCQVGGHSVYFTGSSGGQTSRWCGSGWQEVSVFTTAQVGSSGYFAVTIGDGLVEDVIDIDFVGIE